MTSEMPDFIQIRFVDQHGVEWKRLTSMGDVWGKKSEEKERETEIKNDERPLEWFSKQFKK